MPTKASIDRFLEGERIALIGVSRDDHHFSAGVYRALHDRGYTVVGVNPQTDHIGNDPCYPSIAEAPDVDGAIVMVPAERSADVVRECADRGVPRVWLHRGAGHGSVTEEAVRVADERGLDLVAGACPLMFLEPTGFVHRLHRRIAGRRIATS